LLGLVGVLDMYAVEGREDRPMQDGYADAEDFRTILLAGYLPGIQNIGRRVWIMYPHRLTDHHRREVLGSHHYQA
jgi:hypothetical protein